MSSALDISTKLLSHKIPLDNHAYISVMKPSLLYNIWVIEDEIKIKGLECFQLLIKLITYCFFLSLNCAENIKAMR